MTRTRTPRTPVAAIEHARTIRLETRKRDGSWVATPVSLAVEPGHLYFRTYDAAGKAKRLRNFPEVRVTPCSMTGKPTGTPVTGTAQRLDGADAQHARQLLARSFPLLHGMAVPSMHRIKGWTTLHYELHLEA